MSKVIFVVYLTLLALAAYRFGAQDSGFDPKQLIAFDSSKPG